VTGYALVWLEAAEEQLASAYLAARERGEAERVTRLVARLESQLRTVPAQLGESRGTRSRVALVLPLTLHFEINDDVRVVVVTEVRYATPYR
jgi:hypothetical protein